MTGFLYKDLRQTLPARLVTGVFQILVYGAFFAVLALMEYTPQMTVIFAVGYYFLFLLVNISGGGEIFSGDERISWQCFAVSTPGTMRGQIQSKYISLLLFNLQVLTFSYLANSIVVVLSGTVESNLDILLLFMFLWNVLKDAFVTPFIYGYGESYGRNVKTVFLIAVLCIIGIYLLYGDLTFFMRKDLIEAVKKFFLNGNGIWILAFFPYLVMGGYYLSYRISLKIYRKGFAHYE